MKSPDRPWTTRLSLLAALLLVVAPATAAAACGTGRPMSYDDISAVLIQQNGCGIGRSSVPVEQFNCSRFWALFSNDSAVDAGPKPVAEAIYSQYNLRGSVGTFRLSSTLQEARAILRKGNFFQLSPADAGPDTGEATLTVKRCAVVTRIRASQMPETESPVSTVLAKIMGLVQDAAKTKLSASPIGFDYDIFFEK